MIFSVIDVETTGLSAKTGDRILEIGVTRLTPDGKIVDTLDTLINPGRAVQATHVHGITDEMVGDAPDFRDIIPHLNTVLDGTVIAAHNASFDIGFLREEFRRSGTSLPFITPVCTVIMARKYLSFLRSRSLASCRTYLDLPDDGAHNALADARSAAYLLKYFIEKFNPEINAKLYLSKLPDYSDGLFDETPYLKPRSAHGE
jgi:DNA polymerase III epsilon subunit family exonuclease